MRLKNFTLAVLGALALGALTSCSSEEQNVLASPSTPLNAEDGIEYSLDLSLPSEVRSRGAGDMTVGTDGLYSFSREIDHIWYAVYYGDQWLYDSQHPYAPQAVKKEGGWTISFKLDRTHMDPSQVTVFFWAGCEDDGVTFDDVLTTDKINLNFQQRCVVVNPKYINGGNTHVKELDSFSALVKLAEYASSKVFNQKVTLKRPFAQIHVLSDEFVQPGVKAVYPGGIKVATAFGSEDVSSTYNASQFVSPTVWFFGNSISTSDSYAQGTFLTETSDYEFTNLLSGESPERVIFKEREMDYLGCLYVLAPQVKSIITPEPGKKPLSKLNIAIRGVSENLSASKCVSVDLPSEGIKANERYVIYNRKNTGDGDGGEGGGGFVSDSYAFEILTDPAWDNDNEIVK